MNEYRLIEDMYSYNVEASVCEFMAMGWKPYGSPFAAVRDGDLYYYQAMTR